MNKNIERIYLNWFIQKNNWNDVSVIQGESPDFVLEFTKKKIGIEITNLYQKEEKKGSKIKENESIGSKWLVNISKYYYQISNIPILVKVMFSPDKMKKEYLVSPKKMAKILQKILSSKEMKMKDEFQEYEYVIKDKFFSTTFIIEKLPNSSEFIEYKRWILINNHCGWCMPINEKIIKSKINLKVNKLSCYKKKYKEVILLIVADCTYNSGMFYLKNFLDKFIVLNFGFSSIYLIFYPEKIIRIFQI